MEFRKAIGKRNLKPSWCARCVSKRTWRKYTDRHHIHYVKDLSGSEQTAYLCRSCHDQVTFLNTLLGRVYMDIFDKYPTNNERPELRSFIFYQFLKTDYRRYTFRTVAQNRFFLRRKLALYKKIKVAA